MENLRADDRDIVIFGTGNSSELYIKCFAQERIQPIAYADNNSAKWGTLFHGVKVISPQEIKKSDLVLVCSSNMDTNTAICRQLAGMGLDYMLIDEYVLGLETETVLLAYGHLCDEDSKSLYAEIVCRRMDNELDMGDLFTRHQYFALPKFAGFHSGRGEVFCDCGAYVGDTVEAYITERMGSFEKIYAFEPYGENFVSMQKRMERVVSEWNVSPEKIVMEHAGVGERSSHTNVSALGGGGLGAHVDHGSRGVEIPVYSIDDYFEHQKVDFIKADIESYELEMLKGATDTIKRDAPKLAVSIYHNASDLYTIIDFVARLDCGYHLAVRHHTPCFADTVLYAWK